MKFFEFLKKDLQFFKKNLVKEILKQKDVNRYIFVYDLIFHTFHDIHRTKYYLKICAMNFPYLFLEKEYEYSIIFSYLIYIYSFVPQAKYRLKFCNLNFPEISRKTNNFILPLMMDIQN